MQFVRYERNGVLRLGALDGSDVVDLLDAAPNGTAPAMLAAFSDMTLLIVAGAAALEIVRKAVKDASAAVRTPLAKTRLRAPIAPSLILCSGENYWDHREEKPEVTRKDPEFFLKTGLGVIGTGDDIVRDERVTKKLDYETEMLIIIGKPGRHIPAARAHEHIYGYSVMNDVTARDRQVTLRPDGSSVYNLGPGKNFDTCAPIGPAIVTADEIADPQNLMLRTYVNGELRQSNTTGKMIWTCAQLVEFFFDLRHAAARSDHFHRSIPGGTAWGTDAELGGKKPMRKDVVTATGYLQPGDEVVCEIEGVGRLVNRVVAG